MQSDHREIEVKYVPRKIAHHGSHSGYDVIFEYMNLDMAFSPFFNKLALNLPEFLSWRLRIMRPQDTGKSGLASEIAALPWVARGANRICHFIYGEDTLLFSPMWKNKSNKIIATFHYPPSKLLQRVSPAAVKILDAVVIVGENQRDYFGNFLPNNKISFIPHHVDTEFFRPDPQIKKPGDLFNVVFSGNHMRDFKKLKIIIEETIRKKSNVHFHLILSKDRSGQFCPLPNTSCYSDVTDHAMLSIYQQADLGIMPLVDCTANNSVLEMMSCGLPVICSNVGGIPDYLDPSGAVLLKDDTAHSFVDAILRLENHEIERLDRSQRSRVQALEKFSFKVISQRLLNLYQQVLD